MKANEVGCVAFRIKNPNTGVVWQICIEESVLYKEANVPGENPTYLDFSEVKEIDTLIASLKELKNKALTGVIHNASTY